MAVEVTKAVYDAASWFATSSRPEPTIKGEITTVHDISGGEPGTPLEEYAYDGNGNRQKAVSNYPGAVPLSAELGANLGCPDASGTAAWQGRLR